MDPSFLELKRWATELMTWSIASMNLELICYLCLLIALTIGTVVFPFSLSVFKSRRHMLRSTVGLEPLYEHGFVEDVKFSAKCVYPGKLTLPDRKSVV